MIFPFDSIQNTLYHFFYNEIFKFSLKSKFFIPSITIIHIHIFWFKWHIFTSIFLIYLLSFSLNFYFVMNGRGLRFLFGICCRTTISLGGLVSTPVVKRLDPVLETPSFRD